VLSEGGGGRSKGRPSSRLYQESAQRGALKKAADVLRRQKEQLHTEHVARTVMDSAALLKSNQFVRFHRFRRMKPRN